MKLNSLIENPASYENHAVIWFLNAKILTAAKINQQMCGVYGPSVMSEWKVQQSVRQFKDGSCVMKIKEAAHPS